MGYRRNRRRSTEDICIDRIKRGIESIKNGTRSPEDMEKNLDFLFTRLEETNKPMYEDLFNKYCIVRLKKLKSSV